MLVISLLIGSLIGLIYALSFVIQQKKVFLANTNNTKHTFSIYSFYGILRLIVLGLCFYYILQTEAINFILMILSCLITFWLIVLVKAYPHEGTRHTRD